LVHRAQDDVHAFGIDDLTEKADRFGVSRALSRRVVAAPLAAA
jgi:hypothetical protein